MYDLVQIPRNFNAETLRERRFLAESIVAYAAIAFVTGGVWIGKTVGEWLAWMIDEERYWNVVAADAREKLAEAEANLEKLRADMEVARNEDQNAIIADNENMSGDQNSGSSWF